MIDEYPVGSAAAAGMELYWGSVTGGRLANCSDTVGNGTLSEAPFGKYARSTRSPILLGKGPAVAGGGKRHEIRYRSL
jgi:hypothetical protein